MWELVAPSLRQSEQSQGPLKKRQSITAPTGRPGGRIEAAATAPLAPHTCAYLHENTYTPNFTSL